MQLHVRLSSSQLWWYLHIGRLVRFKSAPEDQIPKPLCLKQIQEPITHKDQGYDEGVKFLVALLLSIIVKLTDPQYVKPTAGIGC